MTVIPIVRLLAATAERAVQLELETHERGAAIFTVLRDWSRRSRIRRDRQAVPAPCTLVPCAGVRIHVLAIKEGGWAYHMRRVA